MNVRLKLILIGTIVFCGTLLPQDQQPHDDLEKAPRPGHPSVPAAITPQTSHTVPAQEQQRDGTFRDVRAQSLTAHSAVLDQVRLPGIAHGSQDSDTILTIDLSGNVANSGTSIGSLVGTSGNVPDFLVKRDMQDGGFAAGTIFAEKTAVGTTVPVAQLTVGTSLAVAGSTGTGIVSANALYIQGRYAYVLNNTSPGLLSIFDVSNVATPAPVGSVATGNGSAALAVQGQFAYVVNSSANTLQIIDISVPQTPVVVGTVLISLSPSAIYVQGAYAYITNAASRELQIIDISVPSSPVVIGVVGTPFNPQSVYVQGAYVFIAATDTLQIIDANDPKDPVSIGQVTGFSDARAVYVQGRYAYVADRGTDTLQVVDTHDPVNPVIVGGGITAGTDPIAVYVQGRYAYVLATGELLVIDVSNPSSLALVETIALGGDPRSLMVQGRYAYVVREDLAGLLQIVDLGGAYIQQLETGGIETGTLAARENVAIGNDLDVKGGAAIARNLYVSGQIMAVNATGAASIPVECSPLRLMPVPTGTNNALSVDANGYVTQTSSSRRFKENIVPLGVESDLLYTVTPVKYDFKVEHSGRKNLYGFIAEELAAVYPSIINRDTEGRICNYVADALHALTIKQLQKHKQTLDRHELQLHEQQATIKNLLSSLASMQAQLATLQAR